jgi:hypothetical protein
MGWELGMEMGWENQVYLDRVRVLVLCPVL